MLKLGYLLMFHSYIKNISLMYSSAGFLDLFDRRRLIRRPEELTRESEYSRRDLMAMDKELWNKSF